MCHSRRLNGAAKAGRRLTEEESATDAPGQCRVVGSSWIASSVQISDKKVDLLADHLVVLVLALSSMHRLSMFINLEWRLPCSEILMRLHILAIECGILFILNLPSPLHQRL